MDTGTMKPGQPNPAAAAVVKAGTTASFAKDVLEASRQALVLVDFWAAWSAPCKQLTALLETVVRSYGGKVRLVTINIDEHPALAGQLRIQSVPTVYAFADGKPLDGFMGAQPENVIRQVIDRLLGPDAGGEAGDVEAVLASGDEALAAGDLPGAAEVYAAVLDVEPTNARALIGLSRVYLKNADLARAEATLNLVPPDKRKGGGYDGVKAAIDLARKAGAAGSAVELEARLISNPSDHQARFDLAVALAAQGEKASAVDHLIDIIRRDKAWNEEGARRQLVQLFEVWGHKDPATIEGRRKLSSLLFR